MRKRTFGALALAAVLVLSTAGAALAHDYASTNDENRANGYPHVNQVDVGPGYVELEFVNDTNSLAFFEYRIDGEELTSGTEHPVVDDDYIYTGVAVDGTDIAERVTVSRTFEPAETVEVRLALGGERDWDFDWVTFEVGPDASTKDDCRSDWADYGFKNQGQCIRFVVTGKDSR